MLARKPTQIFKADEFPTVGAGLPAIAVGQLAHVFLTHRHRRQASSHIGSPYVLRFVFVYRLALALVFITVTRFG